MRFRLNTMRDTYILTRPRCAWQVSAADKLEVVTAILTHPATGRMGKKKLLEKTDKSKRTALHIASFKSKEGDMVKLLLDHGADVCAADASGNTATKLANKTGRRKSKELLDEHMLAVEQGVASGGK